METMFKELKEGRVAVTHQIENIYKVIGIIFKKEPSGAMTPKE